MLRAFLKRPMNGYNFTQRVRKSLGIAREEAARLQHEYVGTEHILLGLLGDDDSVALTVLDNLGVKREELALKIETIVKRGRPGEVRGPDLPYTSRAKKVLELSMDEARELGHDYVGTEHLLLGLVREERGIAAQLLVDNGVTLRRAREEAIRVLGKSMPDRPSRPATRGRGGDVAFVRAWRDSNGALSPVWSSNEMAASIIELMARDTGVEAVFAAQGIDVAALVAALRAFTPPAPPAEPPASGA